MKRNKPKVREERRAKKEQTGRVLSPKWETERQLPRITPKTEFQRELIRSLLTQTVTVGNAVAGTGKSYCTMSIISDQLRNGQIEKIYLSRPSVGMGKSLGLLPGSLRDKFEPYLMPLVEVMVKRHGAAWYETALGNKQIEFVPLEYLRGRSFEDAFVIIDEAQNVSPNEMYTILTRIGEGGKLAVLGDPNQYDLRGENGIDWVTDFAYNHQLENFIGVCEADSDDIVRSGFCKAVVKAREKELGY